ncbi:hypothetical protein [Croceicoccus gelatinilyticus]|uniref:hypothetical protein n=1 Tax=Croceicoccus gelatinilyticus TaxID=2835536 RepID=UPI001BD067D9|nr:hypothetical protein [Croceicoccus gelatinilyticus]MBS7671750.1 hypothetical protein [Croceicoccus gelatinilyticus]
MRKNGKIALSAVGIAGAAAITFFGFGGSNPAPAEASAYDIERAAAIPLTQRWTYTHLDHDVDGKVSDAAVVRAAGGSPQWQPDLAVIRMTDGREAVMLIGQDDMMASIPLCVGEVDVSFDGGKARSFDCDAGDESIEISDDFYEHLKTAKVIDIATSSSVGRVKTFSFKTADLHLPES